MKLYIIRHGETDWNKERKLQGRSDIPINENGRQMARMTAVALKKVPFTFAYTSPLSRAKETAEIIIGNRAIECIEDQRVEEIGFGIYEGMSLLRRNSSAISINLQYFFTQPEKYIPTEGGESIEQLCKRTNEFMQDIISRANKEDTILISTHGATMTALLNNVSSQSQEEFWKNGVPHNCQVAMLEAIDGKISIVSRDII